MYYYLDGSTGYPYLHSPIATYGANFYGNQIGTTSVDTPTCTLCIEFYTHTNIHSATVNASLPNGYPVIYTTAIYGNRNYANSTEIISTAINTTTSVSRSVGYSDAVAGGGDMASEISVPAVASFNTNYAIIGYADINRSVYAGTKTLEWNVDTNSLTYASYLALGSHTPNIHNDGNRWIDFLDAACTVPNSASVFLGGSAATSGAVDPDRTCKK